MLTKEYVSAVKANGNGDLKKLVDSKKDDKSIVFILKNLGYLPDVFDDTWVQDLLNSKNKKIRLNAIKTIGKAKNETIQTVIKKEYFSKKNTSKDKLKHPNSYDYLKNTVVLGDVRDTLKIIPDENFHLTFTSPPYYNARDYSIYPSYKAYLKFLEEVFKLTFDKTKEGRFLIVNTSPVIVPRISRQYASKRYPIPFDIHHFLVEMGWEFIDIYNIFSHFVLMILILKREIYV